MIDMPSAFLDSPFASDVTYSDNGVKLTIRAVIIPGAELGEGPNSGIDRVFNTNLGKYAECWISVDDVKSPSYEEDTITDKDGVVYSIQNNPHKEENMWKLTLVEDQRILIDS